MRGDGPVGTRTCKHPRRVARRQRAFDRLTSALADPKRAWRSAGGAKNAQACLDNLAGKGVHG